MVSEKDLENLRQSSARGSTAYVEPTAAIAIVCEIEGLRREKKALLEQLKRVGCDWCQPKFGGVL